MSSEPLVCDFSDDFRMTLAKSVKMFGIEKVEKSLVESGFSPSVAKALIRNVMRNYGW